jgi:hypothetical protein
MLLVGESDFELFLGYACLGLTALVQENKYAF